MRNTRMGNENAPKKKSYLMWLSLCAVAVAVALLLVINAGKLFSSRSIDEASTPTREGSGEITNGVVSRGDNTRETGIDARQLSVEELATAYYLENYGEDVDPDTLEARKVDFGCHFEIHIYKGTQLEMKLLYFDGTIYEV